MTNTHQSSTNSSPTPTNSPPTNSPPTNSPPTNSPPTEFDCSICCDRVKTHSRNKNQQITCPNCQTTVCRNCQFRYEKDQCMNCQHRFTLEYVLTYLGASFLKEIVKPRIILELMENEERLLPEAQTEVNRQRRLIEVKRNLRFGRAPPEETSPVLSQSQPRSLTNGPFPCPRDNCRGFINHSWSCDLCQNKVCPKCRDSLTTEEHQCKQEVLATLATLAKETRPCPRCRANIYKTEGCNDMYCTHCCTHFCWRTGNVLQRSTNGHYLNLAQYAQNVATVGGTRNRPDDCQQYHFHLTQDAVERQFQMVSTILERALYDDSNAIRNLFRTKFQRETILAESETTRRNLRVKYLENKIDHQTWANRVYTDFKKREQHLTISTCLELYLSTISYLQLQLRRGTDPEEILESLATLVQLCNMSLTGIQKEYGGRTLVIRNPKDPSKAPAWGHSLSP